jgi:hypothetical protein
MPGSVLIWYADTFQLARDTKSMIYEENKIRLQMYFSYFNMKETGPVSAFSPCVGPNTLAQWHNAVVLLVAYLVRILVGASRL